MSSSNPAWSQTASQIHALSNPADAEKAASAAAARAATKALADARAAANAATRDATSGLIDINTVSRARLMTLPGIGEMMSQKIIKGRPYKAKADLSKVIGNTTYSRIANLITASPLAVPAAASKPTAPVK
jgi:competence protein ComEA